MYVKGSNKIPKPSNMWDVVPKDSSFAATDANGFNMNDINSSSNCGTPSNPLNSFGFFVRNTINKEIWTMNTGTITTPIQNKILDAFAHATFAGVCSCNNLLFDVLVST